MVADERGTGGKLGLTSTKAMAAVWPSGAGQLNPMTARWRPDASGEGHRPTEAGPPVVHL